MCDSAAYIEKLAGGNEIIFEKPQIKTVSVVADIAEFYIPLGELIDVNKELERLAKELENTENEIERANGKLANKGFVEKAPAHLIDAEKAKLIKFGELKNRIVEKIEELKANL